MKRAALLFASHSHVWEEHSEVGIIVHRQDFSTSHNFLRSVQVLLDGQARADWWCPWQ